MTNWESIIASRQRDVVTCLEPDASKRAQQIRHKRWYNSVKHTPEYKRRHLQWVYGWRKRHDEEYKKYRREYMREYRKTHKPDRAKERERNRRWRERKKAMKEAS